MTVMAAVAVKAVLIAGKSAAITPIEEINPNVVMKRIKPPSDIGTLCRLCATLIKIKPPIVPRKVMPMTEKACELKYMRK